MRDLRCERVCLELFPTGEKPHRRLAVERRGSVDVGRGSWRDEGVSVKVKVSQVKGCSLSKSQAVLVYGTATLVFDFRVFPRKSYRNFQGSTSGMSLRRR